MELSGALGFAVNPWEDCMYEAGLFLILSNFLNHSLIS